MGRPALLLDRDGTICEEVGYLREVDEVQLIPGSAEAIRQANRAGLRTIVATNQAGVAHDLFDEQRLAEIHDRMRALLAEEGARLDGIYYCPHHPEARLERYRLACPCRKPQSGLLVRAREELGIDLGRSFMIGDQTRDLLAGVAVGASPVLVLTGHGDRHRAQATSGDGVRPRYVAPNLLDAVQWILEGSKPRQAGTELEG